MYLVRFLFDIGTHSSGEMGSSAISWQEIAAWQDVMGLRLRAWELLAIKDASQAYVTMMEAARSPTCPPPFDYQIDHTAVERQIRHIFR